MRDHLGHRRRELDVHLARRPPSAESSGARSRRPRRDRSSGAAGGRALFEVVAIEEAVARREEAREPTAAAAAAAAATTLATALGRARLGSLPRHLGAHRRAQLAADRPIAARVKRAEVRTHPRRPSDGRARPRPAARRRHRARDAVKGTPRVGPLMVQPQLQRRRGFIPLEHHHEAFAAAGAAKRRGGTARCPKAGTRVHHGAPPTVGVVVGGGRLHEQTLPANLSDDVRVEGTAVVAVGVAVSTHLSERRRERVRAFDLDDQDARGDAAALARRHAGAAGGGGEGEVRPREEREYSGVDCGGRQPRAPQHERAPDVHGWQRDVGVAPLVAAPVREQRHHPHLAPRLRQQRLRALHLTVECLRRLPVLRAPPPQPFDHRAPSVGREVVCGERRRGRVSAQLFIDL